MSNSMPESNWEYTRYAEVMMDEIKNEFDIYYSRESLYASLNRFANASPKDSNYIFIKCELEDMLRKSGISDFNTENLSDIRMKIEAVPTSHDLYISLFRKLYDAASSFKTPKDYMDRLVKRLADDEFRGDSARLAIVKQFIKHTDYHTMPVIDFVVSESKSAVPESDKISYALNHIDEGIFDNLSDDLSYKSELTPRELTAIECKVLMSKFETELKRDMLYDTVKKIFDELSVCSDDDAVDKLSCDFGDIRNGVVDMVDYIIVNDNKITFPVIHCSSAILMMMSYVDNIDSVKVKESKKAKQWFGQNSVSAASALSVKLRTAAEKYDEFIAGSEYEDVFVELINTAGESVLHVVRKENKKLFNKHNNERKKDARKSRKPVADWSLLKFADSLSNGNFYTNGKTKNDLYMFAFAFGMTFSVDYSCDDYDETRDINKNLFHDYYNHNLLNYVEKGASYEAEPTGSGINFKNFVETIYLYYLSAKGISVREKIQKAEVCIEKCKKKSRAIVRNSPFALRSTEMYSSNYNTIMNLPENELVDYICENFYFDQDNNSSSAITYASEEITAYENCRVIMSEIAYAGGAVGDLRYECGIEDVDDELRHIGIEDENFKKLIINMNRLLEKKAEFFEEENFDKRKIKRTDLITLAYYYKILESGDAINDEMRNFTEVYEDFCDYINPVLAESRYQPISTKNIFDMFILLNLYRLSADTPIQF